MSVNKYKKIGCFQINEQAADHFDELFEKADETFDINNYKEKLPQYVLPYKFHYYYLWFFFYGHWFDKPPTPSLGADTDHVKVVISRSHLYKIYLKSENIIGKIINKISKNRNFSQYRHCIRFCPLFQRESVVNAHT